MISTAAVRVEPACFQDRLLRNIWLINAKHSETLTRIKREFKVGVHSSTPSEFPFVDPTRVELSKQVGKLETRDAVRRVIFYRAR